MRGRVRKLEQRLAKLQEPPPIRFRFLLPENGRLLDLDTGEVVEPSAPWRIVLTWEDETDEEGRPDS